VEGSGIVSASAVGTALDAANVRRAFRRVVKAAGLNEKEWTPRELRHSFVSLLSDSGVTLESIAELCGHAGTRVTEAVTDTNCARSSSMGQSQWIDLRPREPSWEPPPAPIPLPHC
jgi:site-specific recombinase XerD